MLEIFIPADTNTTNNTQGDHMNTPLRSIQPKTINDETFAQVYSKDRTVMIKYFDPEEVSNEFMFFELKSKSRKLVASDITDFNFVNKKTVSPIATIKRIDADKFEIRSGSEFGKFTQSNPHKMKKLDAAIMEVLSKSHINNEDNSYKHANVPLTFLKEMLEINWRLVGAVMRDNRNGMYVSSAESSTLLAKLGMTE